MAGDTMRGILPTGETFTRVGTELDQAMTLIRTGIELVIPVDGVVAVVIGVFWVSAAVAVYGLLPPPGGGGGPRAGC